MSGRPNRRRYSTYVILSLLVQIWQQLEHLPYKPPITCLFLALNIGSFLMPLRILNYDLWDIHQNCLLPHTLVRHVRDGDYLSPLNRLVLSSFIHVGDHHLYYNMLSLVWKGIQLEQLLGSYELFFLIVYSILASHTIMVFISTIMFHYGILSWYSGYHDCAVGFSAVLFSMKYILYRRSEGWMNIYGFPINLKVAAWVELVVISMLNPHASFVGHLSGIVAGMVYEHLLPRIAKLKGSFQRSYSYSRSVPRFASSNVQVNEDHDVPEEWSSPNAFVSQEEMRRRRLQRYDTR